MLNSIKTLKRHCKDNLNVFLKINFFVDDKKFYLNDKFFVFNQNIPA